ncbi:hypothetical protein A2U01_0116962, partial [Trifolium medium]|nr:hypothetical protein [Trifolium medium]
MLAQRACQQAVGLPFAFCCCSEGLLDVPSLSFVVSRPASLTGFDFL